MTTKWKYVATALIATVLLGLTACGSMSTREKDTAIGAVVGGVAGSVLGGGTAGTVGGAVVGGVIGNQVGKDKK
jgi:osmotically inducible lipoprotein OsmB